MNADELLEGIDLDHSEVVRLLSAHDGEPWHCDDKTFTDDEGQTIVAPNHLGEYDSTPIMEWLGY